VPVFLKPLSAGTILKLPHKLLLAAPVPAVTGVIFFLMEQNHIYTAPGAERIDHLYSLLSLLSMVLLCVASAIGFLAPMWLWTNEPAGKLAVTGFLLTIGSVLFAVFAYEAFIFEGITTVANFIWIFFVVPPASPAILSGVATIAVAGVRYARTVSDS
jgi:hypothetical protein